MAHETIAHFASIIRLCHLLGASLLAQGGEPNGVAPFTMQEVIFQELTFAPEAGLFE